MLIKRKRSSEVSEVIKETQKREKWIKGKIFQIQLKDGSYGYCQLPDKPLVNFFNYRTFQKDDYRIEDILNSGILFSVWVFRYAINQDSWHYIGRIEVKPEHDIKPWFFRYDSIAKKFYLYKGGEEVPSTWEECKHLECAAVWEPHHVEERLLDYFEGRPNTTLEYLKPEFLRDKSIAPDPPGHLKK